MKVSFHPHAKHDLRWFAFYYSKKFPEGKRPAEQNFKAALKLLKRNPRAGRPVEETSARLMPVLRTPFVLVFLVKGDTIDILRVWDARANPENMIET